VDGLLLCADTEEAMGADSKSQVHKIPVAHINDGKIAIGGAGRAPLIEFINQDLPKSLSVELASRSDVEIILNEYAQKIFRRHIKPFIGIYAEPQVAFLIGLVHHNVLGQNVCSLYKWEDNFVYSIPPYTHTSIGIGTLQSTQLINQIHFFSSYETMMFFAIRTMLRVKQTVQGCGGRTESVFLDSGNDLIIRPGAIATAEIEHLVEISDEVVMDRVFSSIAYTGEDSKRMETEFAILKASILNLQRRYKEVVHVLDTVKIEPKPSTSQT
jgi:hypothetical protein